jgi:uncharacterized membrane protein YkoI
MVKTIDKILLGLMVVILVGMNGVFISAGGLGAIFGEEEAKGVALQVVPGEVGEVDVENEGGEILYEVDIAGDDGEKEVVVNQQGEIVSIEDEEVDEPITGTALERASQAALDYIGEGRVTDSEIGDEEGYYEIEITLDDGDEVDVHLDENFNVLSVED